MADSQIQIEIKAIDNMSNTLKNIETNTQSSTNSLKQAFTKVQGAMLNLGQVAQGIHNIFEINQNRTRILENATDRLENAQINLKRAFNSVKEAEKDLINVQRSHERDSINLEQSQLNLVEAQKRVKELTLEAGHQWAEGSEQAKNFKQAQIDLKNAEFDLIDAQRQAASTATDLADAQQNVKDKQDDVTKSTNGVDIATRRLKKATGDAKWAYVDMGVQIVSVAGNLSILFTTLSTFPAIQGAIAAGMAAISIAGLPVWLTILAIAAAIGFIIAVWKNWDLLVTIATKNLKNLWDLLKSIGSWMRDTFMKIINSIVNGISKAINKAKSLFGMKSNEPTSGGFATGGIVPSAGKYMLQKGETIMPSRSNGGNVTVNITGNIYGTDPDEISDAILNKVRKRINLG